jgi:hypothetical protein
MTNFEKAKEMFTLEKFLENFTICNQIRELRGTKNCGVQCPSCIEWLNQEYKEPILDDVEREYLSAVIKPFRNKIICIRKERVEREFIKIVLINDTLSLPYFKAGTMYKGMKLNKRYTLKELEL